MNVIHRLWLGPRPMPQSFREYGYLWEALNRGWKCHDWSWHDLPSDLANQDVMDDVRSRCTHGDSIELATQLADIIDYELVLRFGGVYVNCDMQPVRPLLELGQDVLDLPWVSREDDQHVVNAAFGGPPEHPFWAEVVALLPVRYWRLRAAGEQEMNQLTGPHLLGEAIANTQQNVAALSVDRFNSVHWSSIPLGSNAHGQVIPDRAIAVHHWDHRRTQRSNVVS